MKKIQCTAFMLFFCIGINAQEEYLEFEEGVTLFNRTLEKVAPLSDNVRLNSQNGALFKTELIDFTDEQSAAFNYALQLWAEKLPISKPINVQAKFANLSGDRSYNVVIKRKNLRIVGFPDNTYYPSALFYQIENNNTTRKEPDIAITFNSSLSNWNYKIDNALAVQANEIDFVTIALRAIAKGLGFANDLGGSGSDIIFRIKKEVGTYAYNLFCKNTQSQTLCSFESKSPELTTFVTSGNVYWNGDNQLKLYSPSAFVKNESLNFFEDEATIDEDKQLMYYSQFGATRKIGSKVKKVLYDIGWKQLVSTVDIQSDQIGSNGIVNYNTNTDYSFYSNTPLQNYLWRFEIQKTDGDFEQIATGTSSTFSIRLPQMKDSYYRVSSGQIKGRIHVEGHYLPTQKTLTGNFSIHINYQPETPSFKIAEIIPIDEYQTKLIFNFFARGAHGYSFSAEDSYYIDTFTIPETGFITYTFPDAYIGEDYIFSLRAYNEYGSSNEVYLNYSPSSANNSNLSLNTQIIDNNVQFTFYDQNRILHKEVNVNKGRIMDVFGTVLDTFTSSKEISVSSLKSGYYILQVSDKSGKTYTSKFYKP